MDRAPGFGSVHEQVDAISTSRRSALRREPLVTQPQIEGVHRHGGFLGSERAHLVTERRTVTGRRGIAHRQAVEGRATVEVHDERQRVMLGRAELDDVVARVIERIARNRKAVQRDRVILASRPGSLPGRNCG